jgi:hypothetical protein
MYDDDVEARTDQSGLRAALGGSGRFHRREELGTGRGVRNHAVAGAAVLVVGPLAGVFVDRLRRRAIMLGSEVVRAALVGGLTVLAFLPVRVLPAWAWLVLVYVVVYVVVFVLNSAGQFFGPARFGTIREVVEGTVDRTKALGSGRPPRPRPGYSGHRWPRRCCSRWDSSGRCW